MDLSAQIARKAQQRAMARRKVSALLDAARDRPAPMPSRAYSKAYSMGANGLPSPVAPTAIYSVKTSH
jgi:hypothetical protein